jgi:hypothetical protein
VAFRAKVGKRYQLPHKGIIPEEFGVVWFYFIFYILYIAGVLILVSLLSPFSTPSKTFIELASIHNKE